MFNLKRLFKIIIFRLTGYGSLRVYDIDFMKEYPCEFGKPKEIKMFIGGDSIQSGTSGSPLKGHCKLLGYERYSTKPSLIKMKSFKIGKVKINSKGHCEPCERGKGKYPEGKIKRVLLEFEDGSLEVKGKNAEEWKRIVDSQATMGWVHGMRTPPLKWKIKLFKLFKPYEVKKGKDE